MALSGKTVLVTGGTAGIGAAIVEAFARLEPAALYFTGRNATAGATLVTQFQTLAPACRTQFIQCDLSSPRETIRQQFAKGFTSERLDVFVANAGIMAVPPGLTSEGFEIQFGTNYLGHAVLLRLLLPVMEQTAALPNSDVRFVVMSSVGHAWHPPGGIQFDQLRNAAAGSARQRYGQSKLAGIFLAKAMAKRYPQVTSLSVHPGIVKTEIGKGHDGSAAARLLKLSLRLPWNKTPTAGAANPVWATVTAKTEVKSGGYYDPVGKVPGIYIGMRGAASIVHDEGLADRLWEWTESELSDLQAL